jgi:hypothetical protein
MTNFSNQNRFFFLSSRKIWCACKIETVRHEYRIDKNISSKNVEWQHSGFAK